MSDRRRRWSRSTRVRQAGRLRSRQQCGWRWFWPPNGPPAVRVSNLGCLAAMFGRVRSRLALQPQQIEAVVLLAEPGRRPAMVRSPAGTVRRPVMCKRSVGVGPFPAGDNGLSATSRECASVATAPQPHHRCHLGAHERGRPKNRTYPSASFSSNPCNPSSSSLSGCESATLRDENSSANASGSGT